jgi:SpoVK/Ycf46/Vps4 family AAA+-type ATPase
MSTKYSGFMESSDQFFAGRNQRLEKSLPAGVYTLGVTAEGHVYFERSKIVHDQILDLPSKVFSQVIGEMEYFLKPDTRASFKDYGFLYKRSALLFGPPGTGKTVIVNRIAREVVKAGGVVLFCPRPDVMEEGFKILDSTQPETPTMVIFEEFEELLESFEGELLSLLDGEIQKNNVIYIATTNHIEEVPKRLMRPGRMSTVIEVGYPEKEAREYYFKTKLKAGEDISPYVAISEGFSVDEMKELVLATKCLGLKLDDIAARIRKVKGMEDPSDRDDLSYGLANSLRKMHNSNRRR